MQWGALVVALVCTALVVRASAGIDHVDISTTHAQTHHTDCFAEELRSQLLMARRAASITFLVRTNAEAVVVRARDVWTKALVELFEDATVTSDSDDADVDSGVLQWTANVSPTAPVGVYQLEFATAVEDDDADAAAYRFPRQMVILFNPWAPDEQVYMADDELRTEYVLKQHGQIYRGSASDPAPEQWNYAQFTPSVFTTALRLLATFGGDRSNASLVSRHFTFAVNAQKGNERGLLLGKWEGSYDGGRPPTFWQDTQEIAEKYLQSGQPVKWAQCWVFGAALNSMLRAVGIPSRQITVFNSAHETPGKDGRYHHIIGMYYGQSGRLVKMDNEIWNFHSWNEAWLGRTGPDSVTWAAVDATPQEKSEGRFEMGPAQVTDIKARHDNARFDTAFVVSEVAAQVQSFVLPCDSVRCLSRARPVTSEPGAGHDVGEPILTSPVGGDAQDLPEEITKAYHSQRVLTAPIASGVHARLQVKSVVGTEPVVMQPQLTILSPPIKDNVDPRIVDATVFGYWVDQRGRLLSGEGREATPAYSAPLSGIVLSDSNVTLVRELSLFRPFAAAGPSMLPSHSMLWTMMGRVRGSDDVVTAHTRAHVRLPTLHILLPTVNAALVNRTYVLHWEQMRKQTGAGALPLLFRWSNPTSLRLDGVLRLHASVKHSSITLLRHEFTVTAMPHRNANVRASLRFPTSWRGVGAYVTISASLHFPSHPDLAVRSAVSLHFADGDE